MKYDIVEYFCFTRDVLEIISGLDSLIFDEPYTLEKMIVRTNEKNNCLILVAFSGNEAIGFKAGFEENDKFHSWIGGVIPSYRGNGVSKELMLRQHSWAKENGFKTLRTHTEAQYERMLKVNLKAGFKIIDRQLRPNGTGKIILEKDLR